MKKTNKKGFTMIELLAVIVILAVIALIATPILTNVIAKSKKGAAERSAESWLKEVRTTIGSEKMKGKDLEGTYLIDLDGNLCAATDATCQDPVIIEMVGNRPSNGIVVIEDGKIMEEGTSLVLGDYKLSYNEKKGSTSAVAYNPYELGTPYIIDPGDGVRRVFYVLEDGDNTELTKGDGSYHTELDKIGTAGKGEVSLIMSENIGDPSVYWCNNREGSRSCNAVGARAYLKTLTTDQGWKVNVDLPTYYQLYNANQDVFLFDTGSSGYYQLKGWLRGGLYTIEDTTLPQGYWTSTASSIETFSPLTGSDKAWRVYQSELYTYKTRNGLLHHNYLNQDLGGIGVRPVITLKKADL